MDVGAGAVGQPGWRARPRPPGRHVPSTSTPACANSAGRFAEDPHRRTSSGPLEARDHGRERLWDAGRAPAFVVRDADDRLLGGCQHRPGRGVVEPVGASYGSSGRSARCVPERSAHRRIAPSAGTRSPAGARRTGARRGRVRGSRDGGGRRAAPVEQPRIASEVDDAAEVGVGDLDVGVEREPEPAVDRSPARADQQVVAFGLGRDDRGPAGSRRPPSTPHRWAGRRPRRRGCRRASRRRTTPPAPQAREQPPGSPAVRPAPPPPGAADQFRRHWPGRKGGSRCPGTRSPTARPAAARSISPAMAGRPPRR